MNASCACIVLEVFMRRGLFLKSFLLPRQFSNTRTWVLAFDLNLLRLYIWQLPVVLAHLQGHFHVYPSPRISTHPLYQGTPGWFLIMQDQPRTQRRCKSSLILRFHSWVEESFTEVDRDACHPFSFRCWFRSCALDTLKLPSHHTQNIYPFYMNI